MTAEASADYDAAVIKSTTADQKQAQLNYEDLTNGGEGQSTEWQLGQSEGEVYSYTWTIYGLQGAVDTGYMGIINYNDGTSETVSWTQPARIANDGDIVVFPELLKSRIAKIMLGFTKFALAGDGLTDEWQAVRAMMFATTWFNDIVVDG